MTHAGCPWSVRLLGGFELTAADGPVPLPADAQRLIAFLALQRGRVSRARVAGTLWMERSDERANGSLRSALWRLRSRAAQLVDSDTGELAINDDVYVDVDELIDDAKRLATDAPNDDPGDPDLFGRELLPGWYDDWVLIERERLHQRSLHALEALAGQLTRLGRHMAAIEAALAAIRLDPLRESAHRCLIAVHLDEGNQSEALRQYETYRALLAQQLGLEPSFEIDEVTGRDPRTRR